MQILRTFDEPFYQMSSTLDGADYQLEFRYSQREACWYFSILLTNGTLLVAGVKVVCNRSLLGRFADSRLPPGVLLAKSNSQDASPPDLTELGEDRRVTLLYVPGDEVGAA